MRDDDALENNPKVVVSALQDIHEQIFGWVLTRCAFDQNSAQDLVQQAYVELLSGRARYKGNSSLKTFVFAVVQNLARSQRRKKMIRMRILTERAVEISPDAQAEHDDQKIDKAAMWRVVESLPARQRDITELVFWLDLSIEEASQVMGVTVGTARTHYDRAKKALATRLSDWRDAVGQANGITVENDDRR